MNDFHKFLSSLILIKILKNWSLGTDSIYPTHFETVIKTLMIHLNSLNTYDGAKTKLFFKNQ